MAFVVAEDKVEDFLKEKADKGKIKQIYKVTERFEKHHKPKQQTNADRIRVMSDEELAALLARTSNDCYQCRMGPICDVGRSDRKCQDVYLQWLKSEAKE